MKNLVFVNSSLKSYHGSFAFRNLERMTGLRRLVTSVAKQYQQYQQVFLEKLTSMSRFQWKSNTILCLNFTCYFSKFRIWLWAFFMWTLNECLVLEVLLQMWQISSGRITCFASICLVTSILLDFVWPQMLQTHWFSTLEQLASTKKGSWSCVISTLPGTSRSIIIQNGIILCLLLFGECLRMCVFHVNTKRMPSFRGLVADCTQQFW